VMISTSSPRIYFEAGSCFAYVDDEVCSKVVVSTLSLWKFFEPGFCVLYAAGTTTTVEKAPVK
jgi:hypothetical protein